MQVEPWDYDNQHSHTYGAPADTNSAVMYFTQDKDSVYLLYMYVLAKKVEIFRIKFYVLN